MRQETASHPHGCSGTAREESSENVIHGKYPMHSSIALERNRSHLTRFECLEILQYEAVYFVGKYHAKSHDLHEASISPTGRKSVFTDEKGHYCILPGDHIQYRYEMLRFIASGSYGCVYKCKDHKTGDVVAVKMCTRRDSILREAKHETNMMEYIQHDASGNTCYHPGVVKMHEFFRFRKHVVIVYELLGMDLYEHMKVLQFRGCRESFLKCVAVQIFDALRYLHGRNIVHCDVKPENILLCGHGSTSVKLIDFGSSCHAGRPVFGYVQSRYYRAPEVFLGLPYGPEVDVWSFGCVLFELLIGKPLFSAPTEGQMLGVIASLLGPIPGHMARASSRRDIFFEASSNILKEKCAPASSALYTFYTQGTTLADIVPGTRCSPSFVDLLTKCLQWDPKARITPQEALEHPWFGLFSTHYIRPASHHIPVHQSHSEEVSELIIT